MKALLISIAALAVLQLSPQSVAAQQGALGITMSDNTRGGVLITTVVPGSPAAAIGLKSGDRLIAIGGKPVATYLDVVRLIGAYKPNTRVELKIDRGGWTKVMLVVLGDVRRVMANNAAAQPRSPIIRPGILSAPEYIRDLRNESPADIDDQHGFGG